MMASREQDSKKIKDFPFHVRGLEIESEGEEEDYRLAPPEGKSSDEILVSLLDPELLARAKNPPPLEEPQTRGPIRLQFTLGQLLAIITFASVGLAGARVLPSGIFSFLVGFVVIALLWGVSQIDVDDSTSRWVFIALITVYVTAAIATLIMR